MFTNKVRPNEPATATSCNVDMPSLLFVIFAVFRCLAHEYLPLTATTVNTVKINDYIRID